MLWRLAISKRYLQRHRWNVRRIPCNMALAHRVSRDDKAIHPRYNPQLILIIVFWRTR